MHGGIINLPFIGGLYTQEEGFFPTFTAGRFILNKQQPLIISAGLGDSGPGPDDDSDLARESGVIGLFNVVYFLFDEVNDDSTIDRIKKCLQGIR